MIDWLKENKVWLVRVVLALLGTVLAGWGVVEGQRETILAAVGALLAGWLGLRKPADELHLKTLMPGADPVELDAAARRVRTQHKRRTKAGMWFIFLIPAALFFSGCVQVQQYDPITVANVQESIRHETNSFERVKTLLGEAEVDETTLRELEVLHEDELARLRSWLKAEESKKALDGGD